MNLRDTIVPKSDQLNYDDFLAGPRTFRVVGLAEGSAEQPVVIKVVDTATGKETQPYKPCKSMRRVLIAVWGDKGKDWIGKSFTAFGQKSVKFGGQEVGGIRISHVSGITATAHILVTVTRGKRTPMVIEPLVFNEKPNTQEASKA